MFNILSDDSQLIIIKYLDLTDQLALWAAFINNSSRLIDNLIYVWQHEKCFHVRREHYFVFDMNPEQLDAFLCSISPTVRHLDLADVTMKILNRWKKHSFSKLVSLEYTLNKYIRAEQVIECMAVMFPGIKLVKPYGSFDYKHIVKWKQLRHLDLSFCSPRGGIGLMNICKIRMLEKLVILCENITPHFVYTLLQMPALRVLCLAKSGHADALINIIVDIRGQDIHELNICDYHNSYNERTLCQFKDLRKLTFRQNYCLGASGLQNRVSACPLLEELHILYNLPWDSEIEIWKTVANCRNLKRIYIAQVLIEAHFFDSSRRHMEQVLNKRSEPLTLSFHKIGQYAHLIHQHFQHPKLTVSFKMLAVDHFYFEGIQMKFKPLI